MRGASSSSDKLTHIVFTAGDTTLALMAYSPTPPSSVGWMILLTLLVAAA